MNDANAVGDERDGLQPVVSQQQVPQPAHFLQAETVGQVRVGHVGTIFDFNKYELPILHC